MSVRITIEVVAPDGTIPAHRNIEIHREKDGNPLDPNDYEALNTYRATLTGGGDSASTTFTHRYGDSLQDLFAESTKALNASLFSLRMPSRRA